LAEEVAERAMHFEKSPDKNLGASLKSGCKEDFGLLADFAAAVQELLQLHEQQFRAIVQGDVECTRFEVLIHMANEKKKLAKYAYLRHADAQGGLIDDVLEKIQT
jgi:hypothetical protein